MQSRPDQIIVLSLDYDGCGEYLFTNNLDTDSDPIINEVFHEMAALFLNGLTKLIANASRFSNVEVHVYVGSARQDISTDKKGKYQNNNGSCFKNYRQLCAAQGWTFQPLLLADHLHNLPSGTAINDKKYRIDTLNPSKIDILQIQLDDIRSKFPDSPIDFIFIDDDAHGHQILDTNAQHFRFTLPENVTLNLVQFEANIEIENENDTPSPDTYSESPDIIIDARFIERYNITPELSFDPINASDCESIILNQLLVSCVKNGNEIFYPGSTYVGEINTRAHQPLRKEFKLTGNFRVLYFRPCATTSYGYRFEIVSNNKIGSGGYGKIYDGITTLIPKYDGRLARKIDTHPEHSPRVHKYFRNLATTGEIQHLNNNNIHARHLRFKQLTFHAPADDFLTSFAAMNKMPGKNLWAILDKNKFNTQQSISLALSILYAYRDQLHAYQLVLGDIKPDNLLVSYEKTTTTHFVDFDFCKLASSEDHRLIGGAEYQPPEFREKNYRAGTTPASDRYALGLTIGEIFFEFQDDWQSFSLDFNRCKPLDISNDEKSSITKCITLMMDADPAKRCSIDASIEIFEQLELKRLPQSAEIQSHYEQAAALSKTMREAFAGKPASPENIIAFLERFIQEMSLQTHNEYSPHLSADSRQFIAKVASLSAFPTHTKLELIQLASQLLLIYQHMINHIKTRMNQLADIVNAVPVSTRRDIANTALEIKQFLDHVAQKQEARTHKYPLSLENIQIICRKSSKEDDQLSNYRRTFKRGLYDGQDYFSSYRQCFFTPMIIEKNPDPKPTCEQETAAQASHTVRPNDLLSANTYNIERENPAANTANAFTYHVVRP